MCGTSLLIACACHLVACVMAGEPEQRNDEFLANPEAGLYWTRFNCCGLAASYIVLQDLEHPVELKSLARELPVVAGGTSMQAMSECLRAHGLTAQGVRLSAESLYEQMRMNPDRRAIAAVGQHHWVVIGAAKNRRFAVYEYPEWSIVSVEELQTQFKGVALMVGKRELASVESNSPRNTIAGSLIGGCGIAFMLCGIANWVWSYRAAQKLAGAIVKSA